MIDKKELEVDFNMIKNRTDFSQPKQYLQSVGLPKALLYIVALCNTHLR